MDERQWIREIQKGKKEYLENIAEAYYDDIYRFCCFQTGNSQDSYDLAQDTFLKFIRYVENYKYRNLKGYLLTIARNVCMDYFNRQAKGNQYEEELPEECESLWKAGPEEESQGTEQARRIFSHLRRLPDIQREAIILHYYYDMKYGEIARLTGVSTATVKSRVNQGKGKLKKTLRKEDFYDE